MAKITEHVGNIDKKTLAKLATMPTARSIYKETDSAAQITLDLVAGAIVQDDRGESGYFIDKSGEIYRTSASRVYTALIDAIEIAGDEPAKYTFFRATSQRTGNEYLTFEIE